MHQQTSGNPGQGRGAKEWTVDKPCLRRPAIHEIPVEENGLMVYLGKDAYEGKTYIAEQFDAMFTKTVNTVAQHQKYNKRKSDPYNF